MTIECAECHGEGTVNLTRLQRNGEYMEDVETYCPECGGAGEVEYEPETYGEFLAYMEGVD